LAGVEPPLRVDVVDTKHGESFSVPVLEGQSPKHVFNHPYAYEGQQALEDVGQPPVAIQRAA